jgi:DNA adenine methylase
MGHYRGMFNEQNLQELLELFKKITGKFMLTMFPNAMIERYANECGWAIHRVERTISAARQAHARRKQEEWIVVNYHAENQ